jgi:hypothetical protein
MNWRASAMMVSFLSFPLMSRTRNQRESSLSADGAATAKRVQSQARGRGETLDEPGFERHGIANALRVQQALNTLGMRGAFINQALALAAPALAVCVLDRGDM